MAKKVLYIASKESDYSRIKLIRMGLEHANEVDCILSDKKSYPGRILEVCWRFLWMKKSSYDVVVIGFFCTADFSIHSFAVARSDLSGLLYLAL